MSTLANTVSLDSRAAAPARTQGFAIGAPKLILRLEGAAVLGVASVAYAQLGGGWGLFALLFLVPDLSMLGYLAGPRIGAAGYNVGHSYLGPVALGVIGLIGGQHLLPALALIWAAHIGFDRMLGYGLKYATAFGHTHLGVVGRARIGV
jgi:hypothetical protein